MSAEQQHIDSSKISRTQAERTAISDKAMIDAAVALILERGLDKTTLQAIGERSGYSRGLATYRFGSKAGLYDQVCKSIAKRWMGYLDKAVRGKTGLAAICASADAYYQFVSDSPKLIAVLQILFSEAANPQSELKATVIELFARQRNDVAGWVRSGKAKGSIRSDICADSYAAQYVAYISGITFHWLLNSSALDFRKNHQEFLANTRRALGR